MATIQQVNNIIGLISSGFENSCMNDMSDNYEVVQKCIREQLYCGVDGSDRLLNPTYDSDPYFNEDGQWKGKSQQYKNWKNTITPPEESHLINLPPRPSEVPNLFITGTFHNSIKVIKDGDALKVYTEGFRDGPVIESKYGENIFRMGSASVKYYNDKFMIPFIEKFFKKCGYK